MFKKEKYFLLKSLIYVKIYTFLKYLGILLNKEWELIYVFIFEAILSHLIDLGFLKDHPPYVTWII